MEVTVTWEGDDKRKVEHGLQLLAKAGVWLPPILSRIGEKVKRHTDERWAREIDPEGNAWRPLNEDYKEWKRKKGFITKILQRTGYMRQTLNWQLIGEDTVAIGTAAEYAKHHQDPENPLRLRPFLGISQSDRQSIGTVIKGELRKVLEQA
jgi:phage virion morphogenesis protein